MGDSRRHPLEGTPATAVTGEAVVVRRAPDLEALRRELQRVLDSGVSLLAQQAAWRRLPGMAAALPRHATAPHAPKHHTPSTPRTRCPAPSGITSVAVVLKHSAIFPAHEQLVGELARGMGFAQVSLSSVVMPMVKMVPRGFTAAADAYLTPHILR